MMKYMVSKRQGLLMLLSVRKKQGLEQHSINLKKFRPFYELCWLVMANFYIIRRIGLKLGTSKRKWLLDVFCIRFFN